MTSTKPASTRKAALNVAVSADGVRPALSLERVAECARLALRAEGVRDAMISIAFVAKSRIAVLNRVHLGHRGPTDVISFALSRASEGTLAGDIYIAPEVARENARRYGTPMREETVRLVVHGVLHVLGHDHPEGEDRMDSPMWHRQEQLVARALRAAAKK